MDNLENVINKLKTDIEGADKVLIGFGKEFEMPYEDNNELSGYIFRANEPDEKIMNAYKKLHNLVKDKDYRIITLSMDNSEQKVFDKDKVVSPCGNINLLQCADGCSDELIDDLSSAEWLTMKIRKKETIDDTDFPVCNSCKSKLVFNNILAKNYNENGYIEKFEEYKKWLQTTINKKLVIIELSVGMRYPTVIRLPFDKVCMYNQKCSFYRINDNLYQHTKENSERGISVNMSGADFLNML